MIKIVSGRSFVSKNFSQKIVSRDIDTEKKNYYLTYGGLFLNLKKIRISWGPRSHDKRLYFDIQILKAKKGSIFKTLSRKNPTPKFTANQKLRFGFLSGTKRWLIFVMWAFWLPRQTESFLWDLLPGQRTKIWWAMLKKARLSRSVCKKNLLKFFVNPTQDNYLIV